MPQGVELHTKIDWVSFTILTSFAQCGEGRAVEVAVNHAIKAAGFRVLTQIFSALANPERTSGRKFYGRGLAWPEGFWLHYGGSANHILVEITGQGCEWLREHNALDAILLPAMDRVTRLDVATDIVTDVSPAAFVAAKAANRMRVTGLEDTETGMTCYVGSRKSERFARVYKFNPPHPRSGTLRIETVLRSDYAKSALKVLSSEGGAELVAQLTNVFGWQHEIWQLEQVSDSKLKAGQMSHDDAGTLRWIMKAVIPALVKAHQSGLLTLPELVSVVSTRLAEADTTHPMPSTDDNAV